MLEKNLKNLQALLAVLETDHLTKADFVKYFDLVVKQIVKLRKDIDTTIERLEMLFKTTENKTAKTYDKKLAELKAVVRTPVDEVNRRFDEIMKVVSDRIAAIKDGKDADEEKVVSELLARLPEQKEAIIDGPDEIRNKLELLQGEERLDVSAIKGIDELIEELKKIMRLGGGGGGGVIISSPRIETPSGTQNGVNTDFTVGHKPSFITVNGQSIYESNGYSLSYSSGVITLTLDNAPESTDVLRSHY